MPIRKVPGGYQWGTKGKVYRNREDAVKQAQAVYSSGWREKNPIIPRICPHCGTKFYTPGSTVLLWCPKCDKRIDEPGDWRKGFPKGGKRNPINKQIWQMTRAEFIKQDVEKYQKDARSIGFTLNKKLQIRLSGEQHEKIIHKALTVGKPVPAEVLKDYPEISKSASVQPGLPGIDDKPKQIEMLAEFGNCPDAKGKVNKFGTTPDPAWQAEKEA